MQKAYSNSLESIHANLKGSVPIMRTRERHLFFLQKTIELSYWLDKISFRTAPPTEICCLHSQIISIFDFEDVFRLI